MMRRADRSRRAHGWEEATNSRDDDRGTALFACPCNPVAPALVVERGAFLVEPT